MPCDELILLIDTAENEPLVALAKNGRLLSFIKEKDNKSFKLHASIQLLMSDNDLDLSELTAISVTDGPGSYTGLRVGMATAKGICYALNKPLITVGSLELMAKAMINKFEQATDLFFCPMMDARRDEVFYALYDLSLSERIPPQALILDADSFKKSSILDKLIFFGSGAAKWKDISGLPSRQFQPLPPIENAFCTLSQEKLHNSMITNVIYAKPRYVKDFYSGA